MVRLIAGSMIGMILASLGGASIALAAPPAGLWKLRLAEGGQSLTILVLFSEKEGKWLGDFIDSTLNFPQEPKLTDLSVDGRHVRFTLMFQGQTLLSFDGRLAEDGSKIAGSITGPNMPPQLAELYSSQLKSLKNPVLLAKENFSQLAPGNDFFSSGLTVLQKAAAAKLSEEEVRGIADRLTRAAADYGPRWERMITLRLANELSEQAGFTEIALAQARRAERMLSDAATPEESREVTDTLARVLEKAGKSAEAMKYRLSLSRLEQREYAELMKASPLAGVTPFPGRKTPGNRTVLVELFTSADAAASVAIELSAAALVKTFQPSELALMTYQLHAPSPNPLACAEAMERFGYYARGGAIQGIPAIVVDGQVVELNGGPVSVAKERYQALRDRIAAALDKPSAAKIDLTVEPKDSSFVVKANISELAKPGETVFLRFAVIESRIRYEGSSGQRYHHHVVRAMPGGLKGFALTKNSHEETVTVSLEAIRTAQKKHLDDFAAREQVEFPRPERPLELTNLKLVAFIQDDSNRAILQSAQIDLSR